MSDLKDAWKNKNVFLKQLEYNRTELSKKEKYPQHWTNFLECVSETKPKSVLDIGCGCGSLSEVLRRDFPDIQYTGIDYSSDAIELAKRTWISSEFYVKDILDLTEQDVSSYDLLFASAVFDVMPNGDFALEHILKICSTSFMLSRPKFTMFESHYKTYRAYDEITTCEYYHNQNKFLDLCNKYSYNRISFGSDILLSKHDQPI